MFTQKTINGLIEIISKGLCKHRKNLGYTCTYSFKKYQTLLLGFLGFILNPHLTRNKMHFIPNFSFSNAATFYIDLCP